MACMGVLAVAAFFSMFSTRTSLAWDAGNDNGTQLSCIHMECSGGVVRAKIDWLGVLLGIGNSSVADCPEGYSNTGLTCLRPASTIAALSMVASCPSGYTNTGLTCYQGPDTYSKGCTTIFKKYSCRPGYTDNGCTCGKSGSSTGAGSMTCPVGYFLNAKLGRCYKQCDSGYTNTGETCYRGPDTKGLGSMKCKPGEHFDSGRCFPVPTAKMRGNTHMWVVDRGLDLLKKSADPVAVKAVKRMSNAACQMKWQQGLYDGDGPTYVDSPTNVKTAGSHFYNALGKDAWGNKTSATTYLVLGIDVSLNTGGRTPNARESANKLVTTADLSTDEGCYKLGVALHYMTDLTQPMHSTSFSAASSPMMLHPYWESYVPMIQDRFPATAAWDERWKGETPDISLQKTAIKSSSLAPALMVGLAASKNKCTIDGIGAAPTPYTGPCFVNLPAADAATGVVLIDAYQSTASFLFNVFKTSKT